MKHYFKYKLNSIMCNFQLGKKSSIVMLLLLVFALFAFKKSMYSKKDCAIFNVVKLSMDTANVHQHHIEIYMEGDSNNFITHPYVLALTNSRGDTMATGKIAYVRHDGGHSQIYEVGCNFESLPDDVYLVHFKYDLGICDLPYHKR
jgi:hypothetical protein